jgi:hypothetical protein
MNTKTFLPTLCALLLSLAAFAGIPPKPVEIVLIDHQVEFYAANPNRMMEILFRNVGEKTINQNDLLSGLSIVWDGKEYKKDPKRPAYGSSDGPAFSPKGSFSVPFSPFDFLIPQDALASGWHTVVAKTGDFESNPINGFIFEAKKL